jgi:hypothetical protein
MFFNLLESAKVRLLQATKAYSSLERTKVIYNTFKLSKEEKLYVIKQISPNNLSAWEYKWSP